MFTRFLLNRKCSCKNINENAMRFDIADLFFPNSFLKAAKTLCPRTSGLIYERSLYTYIFDDLIPHTSSAGYE